MCSGMRTDVVCSICVIVICYDYVMLCSVSSELRSDTKDKALVSSGLRSDAEDTHWVLGALPAFSKP